MQEIVSKIYQAKKLDKFRTVSRFQYEQRDVRNRLDVADLYIQLNQILDALEKQGIKVEEIPKEEKEIMMQEMVREDRSSIQAQLLELEYLRRTESYKKGSVSEKMRRLIFGDPAIPTTLTTEAKPSETKSADANVSAMSKKEQDERLAMIAEAVKKKQTQNGSGEFDSMLSEILTSMNSDKPLVI